MSRDTAGALCEVAAERERQDVKWGEQDHPDGTGGWDSTARSRCNADVMLDVRRGKANDAKNSCDEAFRDGRGTWRHILREEVEEAFAEDGIGLRRELMQVAAVAVAWIEAIDRRAALAKASGAEAGGEGGGR